MLSLTRPLPLSPLSTNGALRQSLTDWRRNGDESTQVLGSDATHPSQWHLCDLVFLL